MRALDPPPRMVDTKVAGRFVTLPVSPSINLPECFVIFYFPWCSVLRGGPTSIPFADLIQEMKGEISDLRRSAKLTQVDKELHTVFVSRGLDS